jgi:alpha-L-fucosidase
MYAFVHFTTNTFTGKEWGYGDEDPSIFNPTAFDADQIVGTLARCGFKGVILTCKHHDGFCMWPTKTTDHSVTKSPWKDGKGDMVREFSDAAKRSGIGFGVYLSPWDRNSPDYGTPRYVEIYREQLRELLTDYGPVFEVWHDGANGGDGYYGGKRERRNIDPRIYYQWPQAWDMVRKLQRHAVVFSDVGPDVRWIGNESGRAPYPYWPTFSPVGPDGGVAAPGFSKTQDGSPDGRLWMPAETNVSIRPGWFWHEHENDKVRSPKNLLDRYFESVGHGTTFLLNVPPDRRGLIHELDVASLTEFKQALDRMFSRNLAEGAGAVADQTRGEGFGADLLLDDDKTTYWSAPDDGRAATIELTLPEARRFSVIRMREPIRLGLRIHRFAVDVRSGGEWSEWISDGRTVGAQILLRGKPVTADGVRVRILESTACPCLSEISLWLEPEGVRESPADSNPVAMPKTGWKMVSTGGDPALVIDGDPQTIWITSEGQLPPQSVTIDLGVTEQPTAFTVLPRQDGKSVAMVDRYRLEWSLDGIAWSTPIEGEFSNLRANPIEQRIAFPEGTRLRHMRFTALRVLQGNQVSAAEFGLILK